MLMDCMTPREIKSIKRKLANGEVKLDANIAPLVNALNEFDAFLTTGSCGGHEKPANCGQCPAGSWNVLFAIVDESKALRALDWLAHDCRPRWGMILHVVGSLEGMYFALEGNADPIAFATVVKQAAKAANSED